MYRFILSLFAFLLVAHASASAHTPGIDRSAAVSLNGKWNFIIDPQDVGGSNINGEAISHGFWEDSPADHALELQEYDFNSAPLLTVPGSWNEQVPELRHYDGIMWLRRTFEIDEVSETQRYFLRFGAVNRKAEVFLNGEAIGSHEGGFTPFMLEVTGQVRAGSNSLVVKVDSRNIKSSLPGLRYDWWNQGGITRDVTLLTMPETFIRNFFLQLDPEDPAFAAGWVKLDGPGAANALVTVSISNEGERVFQTDANGRAEIRMAAPRELWSPASPTLHKVSLFTPGHRVNNHIGFRTVSTKGKQVTINGEPVFLAGISAHELRLGSQERANSAEDAREILEQVKALNANYVRLTHYPHNQHMAEVADEMGILLWEEIPVYWAIDFSDEQVLQQARDQLSELIGRDRNRASVIVWSVANETPIGPERNAFLRELVAHVRKEDGTRLISSAAISTRESLMSYAQLVQATLNDTNASLSPSSFDVEISDPVDDALDLVAYNLYVGWYDAPLLAPLLQIEEAKLRTKILDLIPRLKVSAASGKPLVLSEFGAGAVRGLPGEATDLWTEGYQASVYSAMLGLVENSPGIAGLSPWVLKDFRSPRRPLSGIQDYYNRKGILDEAGKPKQAAEVLSQFYASRRAD